MFVVRVEVLGDQERLKAGGPETVEDATLLIDGVLERLGNLETIPQPFANL